MTPERIEELKNKLLEPENSDYLTRAIAMMSEKTITGIYVRYFRNSPLVGTQLLKENPSRLLDVRSEHILASLSNIRQNEPRLLEKYTSIWIEAQAKILEKIENSDLSIEVNDKILQIAYFLSFSNTQKSEIWLNRLVNQNIQINELHQQVQYERQHRQKLELELDQLHQNQQKLFSQQKTRLEATHTNQIQQAIRLEQQKQLEETKKFKAEITQLKDSLAREQQETAATKTKLEEITKVFTTKANQAESQLEPLRQTNQRLTTDLLEKTQALTEAQTARTQLRQRNSDLTQELEKARSEQKKLAREYAMREHEQQESINGTRLENALIIDYRHLSYEPAQRLIRLSEIYKAFLEDNKNQLQQTNYSDFSDPKNQIHGVLLLGLEQLLLDLVNLPLTAFFNSQIFRQESVLKQLLGILESPRYRGAA